MKAPDVRIWGSFLVAWTRSLNVRIEPMWLNKVCGRLHPQLTLPLMYDSVDMLHWGQHQIWGFVASMEQFFTVCSQQLETLPIIRAWSHRQGLAFHCNIVANDAITLFDSDTYADNNNVHMNSVEGRELWKLSPQPGLVHLCSELWFIQHLSMGQPFFFSFVLKLRWMIKPMQYKWISHWDQCHADKKNPYWICTVVKLISLHLPCL